MSLKMHSELYNDVKAKTFQLLHPCT